MILTLTMNPALDKTTSVEKLVPEKKMRCGTLLVQAGGGGINVSKAVMELGGDTLAVFPSGGMNGRLLTDLLKDQEIPVHIIPIKGHTRESFVVTERLTNAQYRYVMPGPELSKEEWGACLQFIEKMDPFPSFLVSSGSMPAGVPDDFLSQLARVVKEKGGKLVVDTSGPQLMNAVQQGVYLLKPNLTELCSLVGKDYLQLSEIDDAAQEVIRSGRCQVIVVSMGPQGAMLVTKDSWKHFSAPAVKKRSTVGAGDSMIAGIVYMLDSGHTIEEAVQFGICCGSAATMQEGSSLFRKEDVEKLYGWMQRHDY